MNNHQRNILARYHLASADEIRQGLEWYTNANAECRRLAELLPDKMVYRAAGVVSALSPGLKWDLTILAAERVIRGESLKGIGVRYKAHQNKAIRIAKGADVAAEFAGRDRPKTRAFWHLLCNPADRISVCVDVHAYNVWAGSTHPSDDLLVRLRDRLYIRIASDYISLARELGIIPHQLQAITWIVHRRVLFAAPF